MARDSKDLIVALDIGTSKVACLVAELRADGSLEILGMGGHESKGLKKGVGVNIEATVAAIQRAPGAGDPAGAGESRADGRLQDQLGVRRHRRQPHPQL